MSRKAIIQVKAERTPTKKYMVSPLGNPRLSLKSPEIRWKQRWFWKQIYSGIRKDKWKKYVFGVLVNLRSD